jgi:hypothetical protein
MSTEAWAKWREVIAEQQRSDKSVAVFYQERGLRLWQSFVLDLPIEGPG